jgi:predicted nucleic acid-binding protein
VIGDPSDDLVLDCAVAASAQYLVTGDAHLLRLQTYQQVTIISPQDFLQMLERTQAE